jgi:hypothetical protein
MDCMETSKYVTITRKYRLVVGIMMIGLSVTIVAMLARPREPIYQGRPLTAWLEDLGPGKADKRPPA